MVITELITRLEELKETHGDLPVYLDQENNGEYSWFEVSKAYKVHLYKEWLDSKIPALNHVTPREAAKTVAGRERLEALFVDFHQKNLSGFSDCPVDLHYLRQELGMT